MLRIKWPTLYRCIGKDACKTGNLDCNGASVCSVTCDGESACQDVVIDVDGVSNGLELICRGKDSCKVIALTGDTPVITADCIGESACQDATFDAGGSKEAFVTCDEKDACKSVTYTCPTSGDDGDCIILCAGGDDVCQDVTIKGDCTCIESGCGNLCT